MRGGGGGGVGGGGEGWMGVGVRGGWGWGVYACILAVATQKGVTIFSPLNSALLYCR
jgi:hypothetical protein